jgi:protein-disulfide isomerase
MSPATARPDRVRRVRILVGLALIALLAVVSAIAATSGGDGSAKAGGKASDGGVAALFKGIPQQGMTLGRAGAPVTVEEFIDPQCPFCAQFSREALPTVLKDYVRPGKIKLVLRPLAFIGQDSVTGARAVAAAGAQDKAWTYLDAFYAQQGPENSGYVTDGFLRSVGGSVPGLDVARVLREAKTSDAPTKVLGQAQKRATAVGADSTPTLLVSMGGGAPKAIALDASDYVGSVTRALDAVTKSQQ